VFRVLVGPVASAAMFGFCRRFIVAMMVVTL
jgi:hypothetical protein